MMSRLAWLAGLRSQALAYLEADEVGPDEALRLAESFDDYVISVLDEVDEDARRTLLPFNYDDRMSYILKQPARYHARIQLYEIIDEFCKKYAVWHAKRSG